MQYPHGGFDVYLDYCCELDGEQVPRGVLAARESLRDLMTVYKFCEISCPTTPAPDHQGYLGIPDLLPPRLLVVSWICKNCGRRPVVTCLSPCKLAQPTQASGREFPRGHSQNSRLPIA